MKLNKVNSSKYSSRANALKNYADEFFGDPRTKYILEDAVILLYKRLLYTDTQDILFPISNNYIFSCNNNEYVELIESYDSHTSEVIKSKLHEIEYHELSRQVFGQIGNKKTRRIKKKTTLIYKNVRRAFRSNSFGTRENRLILAYEALHFAFRESFIYTRTKLKEKWYQSIPEDLIFQLVDGQNRRIRDIYAYDEQSKCYAIDRDICMDRRNMQRLQVSTVKYYFKMIHTQF